MPLSKSTFDHTLIEALLDAAVDGIIMIDAAGRIQSFNAAAERIFGYARDEVLGENVAMLAAEPHRTRHDTYIRNYLETGEGRIIGVGRRRLRARRKDGSEFPMELGVSDARLGDDQLFVGLIRDLSEEVAQETALANALNQLDVVADAAVDGIITIDDVGRIQSFNAAAERIFGYARDEVLGENVAMLAAEPHATRHDGYIRHYLETGEGRIIGVGRRRLTARRKDGTEFPMELGVSDARLGDNQLFVGLVRDLSEEVAQEAALANALNQLQAVADTLVDAFITIDARGAIASVNRAAEQMFGYAAADLIGRNVSMLMPESTALNHDGHIARYQTTGRKRIIGATRPEMAMRADGTEFPIELAVSEMTISGDRMFVGVVRDVTERVEQEAIRNEIIEDLQTSNRELDEFAYITSHDLKEPLRGLANNARFLIEDHGEIVPEDGRKRLERIQALCERMERLINSLLYFSRLGRQELAVVDADLNEVVREVVELLGPYLEERGAEVRVAPLPVMRCDQQRVAEVFRNLIVNGVKYNTAEKKVIEISTRPVGRGVHQFAVKDNGVGIPEEFHGEVFKIFRRLNADDGDGGTGSGLTFVQKIVERHSGRIWIESKAGEGATFHFTLERPPQ